MLNVNQKITLHSACVEVAMMEIQKIVSMDASQSLVHAKPTLTVPRILTAMDWFVNQLARLTQNVLHWKLVLVVNV
jgi:hypothetical protein